MATKEIQYNDPTLALISQLLGGKTSSSQTSSISPEAQAALTQLLAQMQKSSTPEGMAAMLAELFQTGAEQVPTLTQAYANAAGARTTGNSSLQLALGDLNADLTRQAGTLAMTQQQNAGNLATQLANATKSVTTNQKTGLGVNPAQLLVGGTLLNQLNKKGGLTKGFSSLFGGADAPTAAVNTADAQLPTTVPAATFSDPLAAYSGSAADGTGFSANLDLSSITDAIAPDFSSGIGAVTDLFGGAAENYGSVDGFGNAFAGELPVTDGYNFESNIDWLDDGSVYDFADGGMPSRGRTYMGDVAAPTLQGALQMSDAQALAELVAAAQKPQQPAPQPQQPTAMGQAKKPADTEEGQSTSGPSLNSSFAPGAQDIATSALRANSVANMFGAGLPTGPIGGLVSAQSNEDALAAMATALAGILGGPLAGLGVKAALGAAGGGGGGPINQGTKDSYADPENDAVTTLSSFLDRDTGGQGEGRSGFGDRGPGGSSGDMDARAAGDGPGGYGFKDGGRPASGPVRGPGTGTSDSIKVPMANISNGEYIMSADVVNAVGVDFFDRLQAAFHKGGKPA